MKIRRDKYIEEIRNWQIFKKNGWIDEYQMKTVNGNRWMTIVLWKIKFVWFTFNPNFQLIHFYSVQEYTVTKKSLVGKKFILREKKIEINYLKHSKLLTPQVTVLLKPVQKILYSRKH